MKIRYLSIVVSAIAFLLMSGGAAASPQYTPLGTAFTYQGSLTDGGVPATGNYDFEFSLYNAESLGTQVGSTVPKGNVPVTDGLFTVQLDFGGVFDGTALWLQIGVAPGGSPGPYTPLTPRQALTATPYAIYASTTPWEGLAGVPAGFADGTDDGASYQNVVVVAKSGGDFTTITGALNSITASDSNRYLIYVAPGVYNEQVTMEQYVDIQGSGELNTKITFSGSASANTGTLMGADGAELRFLTVENTGASTNAIAIYNNAAAPRLTHVTAAAAGGTTNNYGVLNNQSSPTMTNATISASGGFESFGVYNGASSPTMTHVTASASGGSSGNYGVFNSLSSPTLTDVTASASGGTFNYGVYDYASSPTMTGGTASASGGSSANFGVYKEGSQSTVPTMKDVTVSASGGTNSYGVYLVLSGAALTNVSVVALGSGTSYGVYFDGGQAELTNVTIQVYGSGTNYGAYSAGAGVTMTGVSARAWAGGFGNYGVYITSGSGVTVRNSQINGITNSISNHGASGTSVSLSLLSGPVLNDGTSTLLCVGVDHDLVFYDATCG
jgi:hypothetical protein